MSRNFKLYYPYIITLIGFVLFVNSGLTNAQPNLSTTNNLSPNAQSNTSTPNAQPNAAPLMHSLTQAPNAQSNAATKGTSSSITETVNQVLSGSIDGMIGETVNMLTSDTTIMGKDSAKSSFRNKLPSSLTLRKNNNSIVEDSPTNERIQGNSTNNTLNTNKQTIANNESPSNIFQVK